MKMQNDIEYMKNAYKEALKAYKKNEVPVGAIIVKNNKIIAKAHNIKEKKHCSIMHAEILAIQKASKKLKDWRLNDCILYVTMFPCPMCASAINQSRIKKVVCGTIPNGINKQLTYDILNDKKYGLPVEIKEQILDDECYTLLQNFFDEKRK